MAPPQVPHEFESIKHLGAPLRVFDPRRGALPYLSVPLLWLPVLGLLWRLSRQSPEGWPVWLWGFVACWVLLSCALAAGKGLPKLWEWVVAYEDGFAWRGRQAFGAWRWWQVEHVYMVMRRPGEYYALHVTMTDGETLWPAVCTYEFAELICRESFPSRRQRLATAFERGQALDFGHLRVSRAGGITYHGRTLSWDGLRSVRPSGLTLVLATKDDTLFTTGRTSCLLNQVPDPDVLLELAKGMGVDADPEALLGGGGGA